VDAMPFTPQQQQRILDALNEKIRRPLLPGTPNVPTCPFCGEKAGYTLMESPALVPVAEPPWNPAIEYSNPTVPCAVLIMRN